jgi:hypothetical protein
MLQIYEAPDLRSRREEDGSSERQETRRNNEEREAEQSGDSCAFLL